MARIGLLMLHKGNWNGKQIVPRDWVAKSTGIITPVSQLNPSRIRRGRAGYGYLWWVLDGPWNTGPYEGAYSGFGAIGQYITVIPKLDMVVAHKTIPREPNNPSVSEQQYFALLDRIIAARTGAMPRPKPPTMAPYDIAAHERADRRRHRRAGLLRRRRDHRAADRPRLHASRSRGTRRFA